ncbi:MAG TPA: SRPBCC family protein [Caulobacteraceae bacterium]|nr:SRPBCC family protein [Caulobacteraceae bacterium]
MASDRYFYVIYIRAQQETVWRALIEPSFTRRFWQETVQESGWAVGSDWLLRIPDGRVGGAGKVLEFDPPRRLSVSWRNELIPGLADEGYTRCTYELETQGDAVRLSLTHVSDVKGSKMIAGVSQGWPVILSSLKSLLETGEPLNSTRTWPKGF